MSKLWGRKASLVLYEGAPGLDLSNLHFRFSTSQQDVESPSNCSIRVYNLSESTVKQIRGEFSKVLLQAGYDEGFGVVFRGEIKQFRIGKENATDTYLDILAADGDSGYNFGVVNTTLAAGSTQEQVRTAIVGAMPGLQVAPSSAAVTGGIPILRPKVLFGMARDFARDHAATHGQTWSIRDGQVYFTPLRGYEAGEVVVLHARSGLVGLPESTQDGIKLRCLLDPRMVPGCRVRIDNASLNQTVQRDPNGAPVAYNQYKGLQFFASTSADGTYRVFVAEHRGDTRGQEWYTDLICLSMDSSTQKVVGNG